MHKEIKEQIFELYERNILKKYRGWRKTDVGDEVVLDRFSLIGLVRHGFNFNKMYSIVSLTDLGKKLLE